VFSVLAEIRAILECLASFVLDFNNFLDGQYLLKFLEDFGLAVFFGCWPNKYGLGLSYFVISMINFQVLGRVRLL
jgi:hypothetical protein